MRYASLLLLFLIAPAAAYAETAITTDLLRGLIEKNDIRSIEDLLAHLPPESLRHYVAFHDSGSIQGATSLAPRIVVFDSRASFIMSFNGSSQQKGGNAIEAFEFDPSDSRYHPREITFAADGSHAPKFDTNPGWRCTICHFNNTDSVNPRFDSYLGPVYGKLFSSLDDSMSGAEQTQWNAFINGPGKEGRYRFLQRQSLPDDGTWPQLKPNQMLGTLLVRRWVANIAARVAQAPRLAPYRYALLASLDCARRSGEAATDWDSLIEDYLPASVRGSFSSSFADVSSWMEGSRKDAYNARISGRSKAFSDVSADDLRSRFPISSEQGSTALLYLALNLFSGSDFPTNYATQMEMSLAESGGVDDGMGGLANGAQVLYPELLDPVADAELFDLHREAEAAMPFVYSPYSLEPPARRRACELLLKKSLAALGSKQS